MLTPFVSALVLGNCMAGMGMVAAAAIASGLPVVTFFGAGRLTAGETVPGIAADRSPLRLLK